MALFMHDGSEAGTFDASERSPITIKKYANRRLYNTATSCYVTLDYLAQLVKTGAEFAVYDAKSGEDITRSVLTHIIVEEESKGQSLLPISFLRHLISFYGDSLQVVVPRYLEHAMQAFARNQEQMRDYLRTAFDGLRPFASFEEMSKQQMAIFERAMRMLTPFYGEEQAPPERERECEPEPHSRQTEAEIEELRARLNKMQEQLDRISGRREK